MFRESNFTGNHEIFENILSINYQQNKLKLDDIIDSIRNLKSNFSIAEELKCAIKLLKRMKLNESCKW